MAIYPEAIWKPVAWAARPRRRGQQPNVILNHVAVSQKTTRSLFPFFDNRANGVCSHFFIEYYDGLVEQYIDTAHMSAAAVEGSNRAICIEFGGGRGDDINAGFSPAQLRSAINLHAWISGTHGIPLLAITNSKPSSIGVGYHRLGVPRSRYVPASAPGWLIPGGEKWSTAVGKVCPGPKRIEQIPTIIAGAIALGQPTGPAPSITVPAPPRPVSKPRAVGTRQIQEDLNTYARAGLVVDGVNGPVTRAWRAWVADAQRTHLPAFKGVPKLVVDEHYGPVVADAVKILQRRNGLVVDGVLGPVTIAFMRRHGSKIKNRPKNRP